MTAQHVLTTEALVSGYGATRIVDGIDLQFPSGGISVIVGANACGKSTLLKTIARLIPTQSGAVLLDGKRIDGIPTKELARTLGLLPQQPIAPEGIVVADLVGRGRHPPPEALPVVDRRRRSRRHRSACRDGRARPRRPRRR